MKISIIGSGTTGKATGVGLVKHGNKAVFYDIDPQKLRDLKGEGYDIAKTTLEAAKKSLVIFICVPTPTKDKELDFLCMEAAIKEVAKALKKLGEYRVVAIRSTVLPTTTRCRILPLLEEFSGLKSGKDFGLCMNPEFLTAKHALKDFLHPQRIIIGELDKKSGDILEDLFKAFGAPILRTDLDSAEMIKYVANCFLATKISYFNQVYLTSHKLGLDPQLISEAVSLDPRIGTYGTKGGYPFTGSCLPKDLEAFISFTKNKKANFKLLETVQEINNQMKQISKQKNT
ncbi:UDP-glucose/GDP-mannose dehydrogenase family protein [Candidatus Bathyarchaeota archaeon]|nr:UDP-glucose/GDP-mannose dehydrogenase family protein [Candidatus Bathyarchaeota archaeon]